MSRSRSPRNDRNSKYDRRDLEIKDRDRKNDRERHRRRSRSPRHDRDRDSKYDRNRRSRSPRDRRDREKERDRYKERERDRRERSRERRRSRSRSLDRKQQENSKQPGAVPEFLLKKPVLTEKDYEGKSKEEIDMMKLMGFGSFDTTKTKHVPGNDVSAVHVAQKRKYRQYMNRRGGFNRLLDN